MSGYLIVVDGTRPETLATARALKLQAEKIVGPVPFILMLNKIDLADSWGLRDKDIGSLKKQGWSIIRTSAKTGEGVEEAFLALTTQIMKT